MRCKILKTFSGSQDGRFTEVFTEGTEADLSAYLIDCIPADWIAAADESVQDEPAPVRGRKAKG